MRTKLIGVIFIMLICTLFAGCMPVEAMVQPDTVAEIREYVRNEYGGADLLYYEESDKSMRYHFKDRQFGFEYDVISSITPVTLDNTIFGYEETKETNFLENYKRKLWDKLIVDDVPEYFSLECLANPTSAYSTILGYITVPNKFYTSEANSVALNIGRQLKTFDYRHFLDSYMIVIRDEKDEFLGYFDMQGGKVIISEFTTRSFYDFYIKDFFDSDDIYMFESEYLYLNDVPGIENVKLDENLGEDYIAVVYHFIYDNKWYFIADFKALYRVNYKETPMWYIYNTTDKVPVGDIRYYPTPEIEEEITALEDW